MSQTTTVMASELDGEAQRLALAEIGQQFHARTWSVGTSSNYSVVLDRDPLRLLITASGKDKGNLGIDDFVIVDESGQATTPTQPKPSAETLLHTMIASQLGAGAVLHTHSVWATLLSDLFAEEGAVMIEGYEMLKGLEGIKTHEHRERIAIVENSQDMRTLSEELSQRLREGDETLRYGFILRRHGLYTWGKDLFAARRHVEILEFLFEAVGRRLSLSLPSTVS
ncbi:Methylthioribulose-1-phosphate dehydratase [Planctomycetes bacterium Pan216]|uniref:Methylthioribulose-1-phosphate dehydratase n=1 Tax=Kolteria novifilia TaxID=2527975 RepID=A0A518B6R0_9BACT|nr:Methylthioribulose-1-phosphate dehydratase [Planctomycetes bacterium Pan216]